MNQVWTFGLTLGLTEPRIRELWDSSVTHSPDLFALQLVVAYWQEGDLRENEVKDAVEMALNGVEPEEESSDEEVYFNAISRSPHSVRSAYSVRSNHRSNRSVREQRTIIRPSTPGEAQLRQY